MSRDGDGPMHETSLGAALARDAAIMKLQGGPAIGPLAILTLLAAIAGILLLAGLWTPIMGVLVSWVIELWNAYSQPGDPWTPILLGTLGGALALLGPGAWSVDARLFGWKRIPIGDRGVNSDTLNG